MLVLKARKTPKKNYVQVWPKSDDFFFGINWISATDKSRRSIRRKKIALLPSRWMMTMKRWKWRWWDTQVIAAVLCRQCVSAIERPKTKHLTSNASEYPRLRVHHLEFQISSPFYKVLKLSGLILQLSSDVCKHNVRWQHFHWWIIFCFAWWTYFWGVKMQQAFIRDQYRHLLLMEPRWNWLVVAATALVLLLPSSVMDYNVKVRLPQQDECYSNPYTSNLGH